MKSVTGGYLFSTDPLRCCKVAPVFGVASQLISTTVADAPDKAGLSAQQYPCRAVRGIRGGIHRSAEIHRKVVMAAVAWGGRCMCAGSA